MKEGLVGSWIRFFLENPFITFLFLFGVIFAGVYVLPFPLPTIDRFIDRAPVPVDAIPDIGENQQIVFTEWPGRSPQDVEDQVTYPLTVALQGIPGVKSIRSYSMFGFSSIYIIFEEWVEFYWARSRVLERLAVAQKDLPEGVTPVLGPDATALGQVFWYTLEGKGFSLHELRTIQDWYVRYALQSTPGVSEVASVGGFVREYQIDVDPAPMWEYGITLHDIFKAVRQSNIDVGARTIEHSGVEYVIRGVGFIKSVKDIENIVVKEVNNVPICIKHIAKVSLGPALRRGALDKEGAEVVGGVVVVRYGENPLQVIQRVKEKIKQISPGLPRKTLPDGTVSQVKIVPFYDRTELIYETLDTLKEALIDETLVTIIVILLFLMHFRSSMVVSLSLPIGVLISFILMKIFKVDSNIMSLGGIAIAIGAMVDMGIIMTENIVAQLERASPEEDQWKVVLRASIEVGSAILTAISTTILSFIPVFYLEGPEGKLFRPLAYTKTFALFGSVIVALTFNPLMCYLLFRRRKVKKRKKLFLPMLALVLLLIYWLLKVVPFLFFVAIFLVFAIREGVKYLPEKWKKRQDWIFSMATVLFVLFLFTLRVMPLGKNLPVWKNFLVSALLLGGVMGFLFLFLRWYERILRFFLAHKGLFIIFPLFIVWLGFTIWLGFDKTYGPLLDKMGLSAVRSSPPWQWVAHLFPGIGKEFMPDLDEGSFLWMPTTMPHASIGEALDILRKQDIAISQIPEVKLVVGKLGRVESPLDPAPVSMIETVILYKKEWRFGRGYLFEGKESWQKELDKGRIPKELLDWLKDAEVTLYKPSLEILEKGKEWVILNNGTRYTVRKEKGVLKVYEEEKWVRQWRPHIKSKDDLWKEIAKAATIPGSTSAPKLQPIATRIVMLQTGMRAPMGVKVKGKDLREIEQVGLQIEKFLKEVPSVEPATVNADRIIGKPYLEFVLDREKMARYGVSVRAVQDIIEVAIGGKKITTTVEGRERYPVRVRYLRELRDSIEAMERILVPTRRGTQIPLSMVAKLRYVRGPQVIKSEDTFLVGYITFDKKPGYAEVDVVEQCREYLNEKIRTGELKLPLGTTFEFAGNYENQVRAEKRLRILVPVTILLIFLLVYLQFRNMSLTLIVFSAIPVAFSGGFILLWLYGQPWFMDFSIFGVSIREIFHMKVYNLSVAVWVGFIALFGVATDDGVVMGTYLTQSFAKMQPKTVEEVREAVVFAGKRRIRPCLMTVATTVLALLPVLLSTGKGADVMIPMALPTVGGLSIVLITLFVVPVCYSWIEEWRVQRQSQEETEE